METNVNTEPMGSRNKAERIRLMLHALSDRFTSEVILSQSSHYINHSEVVPEAIPEAIHHCTATNVNSTLGGRWGSLGEY